MSDNKKLILFQWLVITVFLILLILFFRQNILLKRANAHEKKQSPLLKARLFELKLSEQFLFKAFPMKLNQEEYSFAAGLEKDYINGYIVMVFDLTVCGKCLYDELEILGNYREEAARKNLVFLAIVGLSDKKEEAEIINLHRSGEIFFPCKMVSVESLYRTFNLDKENFLDTPFYFYISHTTRILDVFKPPYLDTKELNRWLTIITKQEFL